MRLVVFSLPCHTTEEPQELAAPKDGCHPVSADPPAPLLMLLFALLQKSNFFWKLETLFTVNSAARYRPLFSRRGDD